MNIQVIKLVSVGGVAIFLFLGYVLYMFYVRDLYESNRKDETVLIGDTVLHVEVVQTPSEIARGLGGRSSLPPDTGMLFLFESPSKRSFWMKGMRFSIDILWIRDSVVIGTTENIQPEPGVPDHMLRRYLPPGPVTMVIEVPAGWAAQHHVSKGTTVTYYDDGT